MWTSVRKYVRGCNVCQLHSLKQHTFPSKHDRPPNAPWTRIAIDCVGFTRDSSQGHVGVMTGICLATQYPWAEPICTKSTACVQAAVMKILATAPNVWEIVSDNGPEFGKVYFDTFLKQLNIFTINELLHAIPNPMGSWSDSIATSTQWCGMLLSLTQQPAGCPQSREHYAPIAHYPTPPRVNHRTFS